MKKYIYILSGLCLIFLALFFIEKDKFPVTAFNCDSNYDDCFPVAKYNDMRSCQYAVKMGNWLCDSLTDPENITCKPGKDSFAVQVCR
ncbi:MAG: hypothetical protein QG551_158 [Patescibacteria group bacterium]|jgi:hypothetical protein|nr:hypothetical protein [Patescibacteria group bacterium]